MKKLFAFAVVMVCCISLTGCPNTTTNQGKKDSTTSDASKNKGKEGGDKSLKISTNNDSMTIRQGGEENIKVTVNREPASFDEEVHLTFENLPKGVTVSPADGKIAKASNDGTFTVRADEGAGEVSNHAVTIKAKSGDTTASHGIKMSIKKKS
jgi:predicted small secreted protein/uncharacterized membrane protein